MAKRAIDLVLGDSLKQAVGVLAVMRGDKKVQDTIRDLLLACPEIKAIAQKYDIDLTENTVQRGGLRNPAYISKQTKESIHPGQHNQAIDSDVHYEPVED